MKTMRSPSSLPRCIAAVNIAIHHRVPLGMVLRHNMRSCGHRHMNVVICRKAGSVRFVLRPEAGKKPKTVWSTHGFGSFSNLATSVGFEVWTIWTSVAHTQWTLEIPGKEGKVSKKKIGWKNMPLKNQSTLPVLHQNYRFGTESKPN